MKKETVQTIREFNRFYMPALDLLGNHYLGSEYSATEARVFFEIYRHSGCNAAYIARTMNIDKSYLSRIIKSHEKQGYLFRTVSEKDFRAYNLYLTEKGISRAEELIRKSNQQIETLIGPLTDRECMTLQEALGTVRGILEKCMEVEKRSNENSTL